MLAPSTAQERGPSLGYARFGVTSDARGALSGVQGPAEGRWRGQPAARSLDKALLARQV
jgi:hypothetical protein